MVRDVIDKNVQITRNIILLTALVLIFFNRFKQSLYVLVCKVIKKTKTTFKLIHYFFILNIITYLKYVLI